MSDDDELRVFAGGALDRAADWLLGMRIAGRGFRLSEAHDPAQWPGICLVATCDAAIALGLLGGLDQIRQDDCRQLAAFIVSHRDGEGLFGNPDRRPGDCHKRPEPEETERSIRFHLTNCCLGALEYLPAVEPGLLGFLEPFLDPVRLSAWLAARDPADPWLEGNNIVSLASFLELLDETGDLRAADALRILFDWQHRLQEPATGFWGTGQTGDPTRHLHGMAGAACSLHLFWERDEPITHVDRMMDYCLGLPQHAVSACLDVDAVDIIVHILRLHGLERERARNWLRGKLRGMLAIQNRDGGFSDIPEGTRRLDGRVRGHAEPQGLSNTSATFFRSAAIAMIADTLWPGWRVFHFRRMLGTGYLSQRRNFA